MWVGGSLAWWCLLLRWVCMEVFEVVQKLDRANLEIKLGWICECVSIVAFLHGWFFFGSESQDQTSFSGAVLPNQFFWGSVSPDATHTFLELFTEVELAHTSHFPRAWRYSDHQTGPGLMKFSRHCSCWSEVDQCEAVQEHLPLIPLLRSMAAVLGNWSYILHSEQPERSQTDGLQPFGALELLQLCGTEQHLPQGRVQGLTDKAWQAFSVSSCTCTVPTTRNTSGNMASKASKFVFWLLFQSVERSSCGTEWHLPQGRHLGQTGASERAAGHQKDFHHSDQTSLTGAVLSLCTE